MPWVVCVGRGVGGKNFHAASRVGGITFNVDIPVGWRGYVERGKYFKVVYFLFVSCFRFKASIFGLSILTLEECGRSSALIQPW